MYTRLAIKNSKGIVFCTVEYWPTEACVYANWIGYINEVESAKQACEAILEAIKSTRCRYLLNDNRQQTGPWPPVNDWLNNVWMPGLQEAGLVAMAHIHSENVFTQLSSQNGLTQRSEGVKVHHFSTEVDAKNWLQQQAVAYID